MNYQKPTLTAHGSVASLTLSHRGSQVRHKMHMKRNCKKSRAV